jgi:hypothetical protein
VSRNLPIRLSVRLVGDAVPFNNHVGVMFATAPGRTHRLRVSPEATDSDLGAALRQVISRELAARDATVAGQTPGERRAGMRVVDP